MFTVKRINDADEEKAPKNVADVKRPVLCHFLQRVSRVFVVFLKFVIAVRRWTEEGDEDESAHNNVSDEAGDLRHHPWYEEAMLKNDGADD